MTCPHCGAAVETTQRKWQRRMRELGRCQTCGQEKHWLDGLYRNCFECRKRIAARAKKRYDRRR